MRFYKLFKSKSLFFLSIFIVTSTISGTIAYFINDFYISSGINTKVFDVRLSQNNYGLWGDKNVNIVNYEESDSSVAIRLSYVEYYDFSSYYDNNEDEDSFTSSESNNNTSDENINSYNYVDENGYNVKSSFTLSNKINGEDVVIKEWSDSFFNNFIDGHDGWYYYNKVLNSHDGVLILQSVNLNEQLVQSSEYADFYSNSYAYNLLFNFEAVEANSDSILSLWNKNAIINGNDITWNL